MRFMHLADLHLGKSVNGFNMIEDQAFALDRIINLIQQENIDTLIIAGDIYQTSVAPTSAMDIFQSFIYRLKEMNVTCLIISGNHDSSSRLAHVNKLLRDSKIYISDTYNGLIEKVVLEDKYGPVNFFLFPYVSPSKVKPYFPDIDTSTFDGAIRAVIDSIEINPHQRNVIISHQFILNAVQSDSEEIYAGPAEAVAAKIYDKFDYGALGHIHKKQAFLGGKLRYPGALLKYSLSEANYDKTITIVDLDETGSINVQEYRIDYLREMRIIRGDFDDILKVAQEDQAKEDYIHIELTNEEEIFEGLQKLRQIYPNIMTFKYVNSKTGANDLESIRDLSDSKNPLQLFEDFYYQRLGSEITESKRDIIDSAMQEIWGKHENNWA